MDWLKNYQNIPHTERIRRIAELLVTAIERDARLHRADPSSANEAVSCAAEPVNVSQLVSDLTEQRIVAYLRRTGAAAPRDFQIALGLSPMTVTRRLARLTAAGILSVKGHTRSARYALRTEFGDN